MKIDTEETYKSYKRIQRQCITDGYPIPFLINATLIPKKYKLTYKEIREIEPENISEELYHRNRMIQTEILNKTCPKYDTLKEYWTDQLRKFIRDYPEFKNIIK